MNFYRVRDIHGDDIPDLYYCDDCGGVIYEPYPAVPGYGEADRLDRHEARCPERKP